MVCSLGRGTNEVDDIEPIPGYCEWKPSAAIGYLDGGRDPGCIGCGTLVNVDSRNGEGTWGLEETAVCDGLELFWVVETGDCTTSVVPFSCCCCWTDACAAACASCRRLRYLESVRFGGKRERKEPELRTD
jgi:hypothetical protein